MNDIRRPDASAGFTLIELLITTALVAVVMVGLLQLLDGASRVSKVQNDMAQMTETLRFTVDDMVRTMRMAGTGGLPLLAPADATGTNLNVVAVNVQDNVAANAFTVTAGGQTWVARPGTDVLTVRGVIGGDLYDVAGTTQILGYTGDDDADGFTVRIYEESPFTVGRIQRLPASGSVTPGTPILFTLLWEMPVVIPTGQARFFSKYNIGIVTGVGLQQVDADGKRYVDLSVETNDSGTYEILNLNEGGDFKPFQQNYVITAGFLDELVYFISTNAEGEPALFLYQDSDNTVSELVDNIWDLQVALGCDVNPFDGVLTEVGTTANDDEWFLNAAGETAPTAQQMLLLQEVRVSLTGRTANPDPKWSQAPELPENAVPVTGADLQYRYRSHSVRVTVRSHPPLT